MKAGRSPGADRPVSRRVAAAAALLLLSFLNYTGSKGPALARSFNAKSGGHNCSTTRAYGTYCGATTSSPSPHCTSRARGSARRPSTSAYGP